MVEVYTLSLKERTKLEGVLEVSAEFGTIPIRCHEDALLRRIYGLVPIKLDHVNFKAPHFKMFLLLLEMEDNKQNKLLRVSETLLRS
jgi:pre-mRNA-splicing helicase BRR2